jgi:spermidine/putrescine transport system substrate-binding protein
MVSDSRDVIGMALKALGYSANSTNERELAEAEQLLLKQKPYVRNYAYLSMGQESVLVKGDVWMVMMYSGDALMLKEHNPEIMYVVPREGGNIWVDYIAILRSSANKDLARQFINFINEPQIAARLAQFVYYATPNQAAEKLLPKEFLENPIIYPPEEVIEKSEIYEPLSVEAVKARNRIYFRVVAQ